MADETPLEMATRKPRRPVTIWIVQIWLAFLLLGGVAAAMLESGRLITIGSQGETAGKPFVLFTTFFVAFIAAYLGVVGAAFVGLQRRKAYGRWLAIAILVAFLAYDVYEHPNPLALEQENCGNSPLCFHYDNEGELEGARDARAVMDSANLILIWRMISAKSVKRFFEKTTSVTVTDERVDHPVISTE